jgi:hypothetical protein
LREAPRDLSDELGGVSRFAVAGDGSADVGFPPVASAHDRDNLLL